MLEISELNNKIKKRDKGLLRVEILKKIYRTRNTTGTIVQTSYYRYYRVCYSIAVYWGGIEVLIDDKLYKLYNSCNRREDAFKLLAYFMTLEETRLCFGKKESIIC